MSLDALRILNTSEVERVGTCNPFCGACCSVARWKHHPLYEEQLKPMFNAPPFIGENAQGDCAHLVWKNGKAACSIYETRPEICRVFPNHPLSVEILPECTLAFRKIVQ